MCQPCGCVKFLVITTWHQLEQLCHKLDDDLISAVEEPAIRDAIQAVQHVHDDLQERRAELIKRYSLDGM